MDGWSAYSRRGGGVHPFHRGPCFTEQYPHGTKSHNFLDVDFSKSILPCTYVLSTWTILSFIVWNVTLFEMLGLDTHFYGWVETTRTLVPWRQGYGHPTRNKCMGWFAQIHLYEQGSPPTLSKVKKQSIILERERERDFFGVDNLIVQFHWFSQWVYATNYSYLV